MEVIIISLVVVDLIFVSFMLRENSYEQYGCWNVPYVSEIFIFISFGLLIFPFWFIRWIIRKIHNRYKDRNNLGSYLK